ncbi:unnamed protein product [Adineta ricciae]|uniref:Uncharacterized protein n=1 Tax=Adineta ricciae TaxID=249248 RepID=A0A815L744_ADIRI|nr:unnamed protein product [Adineta ricciae]CAF1399537.1 unnamed protein product [Adineta ricciae]
MQMKVVLQWFYDWWKNYNLFMLEENDYYEENHSKDPVIALKHQKYTTRLYILLLMVSLYVLFYITLMNPHSQTITVYEIDPNTFTKLYSNNKETLSCPCSTVTIPYKNFVSNIITFHSICSSVFVSKPWIEALYLINASGYGPSDFRTTARSQFQLLADLCSISNDTVSQSQIDFNNDEYLTIHLQSVERLQLEVNATLNLIKNSISTQIISFLNYLRVYFRGNYIVSALNTNLVFGSDYLKNQYNIHQLQTQFTEDTTIFVTTPETLMCGTQNPVSPTSFSSRSGVIGLFVMAGWSRPSSNTTLVDGFFTGCTPLEALLPSTLDCLYDIKCIEILINYFPDLNKLNFNWTNEVLPGERQNITVYDYLRDLFIKEWSTEVNYPEYFAECLPSSCSYITTARTNFPYAITMFISLYGGLIIILRLIAPFLFEIFLKFKQVVEDENLFILCHNIHPKKLFQSIQQVNLYKHIEKRSEEDIRKQRLITRVYLILLAVSFTILLIFTSLSTEIVTITESNPSLLTYEELQIVHTNTLQCPCSTTTIPYENFLSLSPVLHQVCSSDWVSDRWLSILQRVVDYNTEDWRNRAYLQFKLLSNLCQLAKNTIDDAVHHFLSQSLIIASVLSKIEFHTQLDATLNQFSQSTITSFGSLVNIARLFTQVDQFYLGSRKNNWDTIQDPFLTGVIQPNNLTLQVVFSLPGTRYVNLSSINCICATNSSCQTPVAVYQMDSVWNSRIYTYISYIAPGSLASCSTFSSLLFSQLFCYYSDSNCYSILMAYMKDSYYQNVEFPQWYEANPLIYYPNASRYPPNTSISTIVEQIMIEQWNPSYSYKYFYDLCAPKYCTYSQRMRTKTIVEVVIILISMIGGLTFALQIFAPILVNGIHKLFRQIFHKQQHQQQFACRMSCSHLKRISKEVFSFIYKTVIQLNVFSIRDFGSHTDRATAKHLGKWATRLYFVLLILGLTILTLYTIIQPQTVTITFDKPSFESYTQLEQKYGEKFKCTCSKIATKYSEFTKINAEFHKICTSSMTSDQWRNEITNGLVSNLSIYGQRDYRRFLSAHLQYLQGLCQLSNQSIQSTIEQFLTSLFITTELLTENDFHSRLNLSIKQKKSTASKSLTRLFFLIRSVNHGNAFVSSYGTNFEYLSTWFTSSVFVPFIPSRAIIYDGNCSCGLYSNCTTQANFIDEQNVSAAVPIKGLKMGCLPSESLRSSTLECFYDQSCLNLVRNYTNATKSINSSAPLSIAESRFFINTTVAELMDELFVEQWATTINYSLYFEQCLPLLCSYTYNQPFSVLYTITLILGLQGGLSIVLEWICPKIVRIIRKKYSQTIHPTASTDTQSTSTSFETISVQRSNRSYMSVILICLMVMITIVCLTLFSIYILRSKKTTTNSDELSSSTMTIIDKSTTVTSTMTTTTTSTTHVPMCQLQFQIAARYNSTSNAGLKSPVIADLNGDNLVDIAFFNYKTSSIHVLLGDGRGFYTNEMKTFVATFSTWYFGLAVGDFNNDKIPDVVMTSESLAYIYMMFGNGNGTFRSLAKFYMGNSTNLRGIIVYDFNGDNNSDIAVSAPSFNMLIVLLGNGDGSFRNRTTYYTGLNANPSTVDQADFNGDGHQDISYNTINNRGLGVLLGRGDGTFEPQRTSFVGGNYYPSYIAIGDFNRDNHSDAVISYSGGKRIGVLLGYGNGTMGPVEKYIVGNKTYYTRPATGDFNNDGISDIAVNPIYRSVIYILVGYGDGNFDTQMIFSTGLTGSYTWIVVGDFNNDDCQDILASDDTAGAMFVLLNTCACH